MEIFKGIVEYNTMQKRTSEKITFVIAKFQT